MRRPRKTSRSTGNTSTPRSKGVVGIPFFDAYVEKASLEYLEKNAKADKPFFMSINFMKVHQPNMPHPDFQHKSMSKSKYADSVVENDSRIGKVPGQGAGAGSRQKHAMCSGPPTTVRGRTFIPTRGTRRSAAPRAPIREGGNRVPSHRVGPVKIKAGSKNYDIVGGLDYMATFASLAGAKLPEKDREGQPMVFDSYDMSPVLFGTGKSARQAWFYFTENELTPGAARVGNYKAVFNLRPHGPPTSPTSSSSWATTSASGTSAPTTAA